MDVFWWFVVAIIGWHEQGSQIVQQVCAAVSAGIAYRHGRRVDQLVSQAVAQTFQHAIRIGATVQGGWFSTKPGSGEPSGRFRQASKA